MVKIIERKRLNVTLCFVAVLFVQLSVLGQEYSNKSYKVGIGLGINEGDLETGLGFIYSFGIQKTLKNPRFRISPVLFTGTFLPLGVTDVGDQYYKLTNLGLNGYFDFLKFKSLSLFVGTGGFVNYTRGLIGHGGWHENDYRSDEYIRKLYYGWKVLGGIRFNPPNKKLAYELSPVNISIGSRGYLTAFWKFGIDIKLNKKGKKRGIND